MKRAVWIALIASTALSSRLAAQSIVNATAAATVAPKSADVNSADAIIQALYDANSNLVGEKRDADRFRSLFVPGARLMPTTHPRNAAARIEMGTVDDYIKRASASPRRPGFSEREYARATHAFGTIMQVFSTYETHVDATDTHPHRGINSIQLFNDGERWWVVNVLWDTERPDSPIPAEFLKRSPRNERDKL